MILIDANELLKRICNEKCYHYHECRDDTDRCILYYYIKESPTAYDIDEIVKRLEAELKFADEEKERCSRENPLQFDSAKGYATGIANAIKIVKGGAE